MASTPTSSETPTSLVVSFERRGRTRRLNFNPTLTLIVGGTLLLLGVWYLVATLYLVFRDDMLGGMLQRQAEMRYAYEDRIAALRARIDRVTSRQLVDQDGFESKIQDLATRQAQIETRQAVVATLVAQAAGSLGIGKSNAAGLAAASALLQAGAAPPQASAYAPLDKPHVSSDLPALRGSGASPAPLAPRRAEQEPAKPAGPPEPPRRSSALSPAAPAGERLARLSAGLTSVESRQTAALASIQHAAAGQTLRLQGVLAEVGLDASRFPALRTDTRNQGGPLVPLALPAGDDAFAAATDRLQRTLVQAERLRGIIGALPFARPLPGEMDLTSGFGARLDPFTRGIAMHTGIDFRDDYGAAVRATAAGVVTAAEYSGGYGNMVEVDHGNGLSTRYGHLSAIAVSEGDRIQAGAVVGRLGSTGRSTGPHLHYETRIDGDPVDPLRFLRAGRKLGQG